jgi:hypothetical protein
MRDSVERERGAAGGLGWRGMGDFLGGGPLGASRVRLTNELCSVYWTEGQAGANCGTGGVPVLWARSSTKKLKDAALKLGG